MFFNYGAPLCPPRVRELKPRPALEPADALVSPTPVSFTSRPSHRRPVRAQAAPLRLALWPARHARGRRAAGRRAAPAPLVGGVLRRERRHPSAGFRVRRPRPLARSGGDLAQPRCHRTRHTDPRQRRVRLGRERVPRQAAARGAAQAEPLLRAAQPRAVRVGGERLWVGGRRQSVQHINHNRGV